MKFLFHLYMCLLGGNVNVFGKLSSDTWLISLLNKEQAMHSFCEKHLVTLSCFFCSFNVIMCKVTQIFHLRSDRQVLPLNAFIDILKDVPSKNPVRRTSFSFIKQYKFREVR